MKKASSRMKGKQQQATEISSQPEEAAEEEEGEEEDEEEDEEEEEEEDESHEEAEAEVGYSNGDELMEDFYNSRGRASSSAWQLPGVEPSAYDSMSTILEVDSESDGGRFESSEFAGRISPVAGAELGLAGALSALSAQVERLRRSNVEPARPPAEAGAAAPLPARAASPASQATEASGSSLLKPAGSADSLLMISVSPTVSRSPRPKFPMLRASHAQPASVVEVSNKSTMTAIDLTLMDRLVERYFVSTRDQASQSVRLDWDDSGSAGQRGGPAARRPQTRSVAVGTEKFARERFSLLPPTKTRATQTKADIGERADLGTSETRRFKLNLGRPVRAFSKSLQQIEENLISKKETETEKEKEKEEEVKVEVELDRSEKGMNTQTEAEADAEITKQKDIENEKEILALDNSNSDDSLGAQSESFETNKLNGKLLAEKAPIVANSADKQKANNKKLQQIQKSFIETLKSNSSTLTDEGGGGGEGEGVQLEEAQMETTIEDAPIKSKALIPSVKTELRVIIEFNNNNNSQLKQRQRDEFKSNSTLINGRLEKRSELSSSQFEPVSSPPEAANYSRAKAPLPAASLQAAQAARNSPKEVLERLKAANRRHSLLYEDLSNESYWRQLSKSTVCSEIQTKAPEDAGSGGGALVLSSVARVSRGSGDPDSSLELRSRAARRTEVASGSAGGGGGGGGGGEERVLVESAAGFDGRARHAHAQEQRDERAASASAPQQQKQPARHTHVGQSETSPQPQVLPQTRPQSRSPRPQSEATSAHLRPARGPRLELDELFEDRRQVSKNGRLIYDDRLRERRFERLSPASPPARRPSPLVAHAHQQTGDQGSNLSASDPDTNDSGFAAPSSRPGSSQARVPPIELAKKAGTRSGSDRQDRTSWPLGLRATDGDQTSLAYVDDDDDDEGNQIEDGSESSENEALQESRSPTVRPSQPGPRPVGPSSAELAMISPPAAFAAPSGHQAAPRAAELSTRLTRARALQPAAGRRLTRTSLEQSLLVPAHSGGTPPPGSHSRLKSLVQFESDTDAERLSVASSASSAAAAAAASKQQRRAERKELQSETHCSLGSQSGDNAAKWDYSLRVRRKRGAKVDSTVNTYIKHSRQPLIKLEAAAS